MPSAIKSSHRTLAVFELFSREQTPLTVTQIAKALDIPQSSASGLIRSLQKQGYLEQNFEDRTYYPSMRLFLLSSWMQNQHYWAARLPKMLSAMSIAIEESTVLAMRNGIYTQYLLTHRGRDPKDAHVESGMLFPLACSSTGWCLLTQECNDEIGRIARRTIAETGNAHWQKTAGRAIDNVAITRSKGYGFAREVARPSMGGISILLPPMPGVGAIAVGAGGRLERIEQKKDRILEALSQFATDVEAMNATGLRIERH